MVRFVRSAWSSFYSHRRGQTHNSHAERKREIKKAIVRNEKRPSLTNGYVADDDRMPDKSNLVGLYFKNFYSFLVVQFVMFN